MPAAHVARHEQPTSRKPARTALIVSTLLILTGCFTPPPRQAELQSRFDANREVFEALREMALEDEVASVIDRGREFARQPYKFVSASEIGLSETRADTYRHLMTDAGIARVDVDEDGEVSMLMASSGMANRGWRVSAVWRTSRPENVLGSMDDFVRKRGSRNDWSMAYAPAADNWYFRIIW